jgi:hypothetical protein
MRRVLHGVLQQVLECDLAHRRVLVVQKSTELGRERQNSVASAQRSRFALTSRSSEVIVCAQPVPSRTVGPVGRPKQAQTPIPIPEKPCESSAELNPSSVYVQPGCLRLFMSVYNPIRHQREILQRHENDPPSLTLAFYPEHWTLNNSSKFSYQTPVAVRLDAF